MSNARIKAIWNQKWIPIIFKRPKVSRLSVKLPYRPSNRFWLKSDKRHYPKWDAVNKCWEVPGAWLNDLVPRLIEEFDSLYIIQRYSEQEECTPACCNAVGHECSCSCLGRNHGRSYKGWDWFVVAGTFTVEWREFQLACRLMQKVDKEGIDI